jgi:hypothetical protein
LQFLKNKPITTVFLTNFPDLDNEDYQRLNIKRRDIKYYHLDGLHRLVGLALSKGSKGSKGSKIPFKKDNTPILAYIAIIKKSITKDMSVNYHFQYSTSSP